MLTICLYVERRPSLLVSNLLVNSHAATFLTTNMFSNITIKIPTTTRNHDFCFTVKRCAYAQLCGFILMDVYQRMFVGSVELPQVQV